MDAIKYCLGNLTNFDGRDARSTFWLYVLFLIVINVILGIIVGVAFTAGSVGDAIQSASGGASEAEVQAQIMQQVAGSMSTQVWIGATISLVTLGLFIAAFVRRLRDAALPAAIAAIPVATSLFTTWNSVSSIGAMQAAMASGDPAVINEAAMSSAGLGMVGWLGYLIVIICGLIPTRAG